MFGDEVVVVGKKGRMDGQSRIDLGRYLGFWIEEMLEE